MIRHYKNNQLPTYGIYLWRGKDKWTLDLYFNHKVWVIARGNK